MADPVKFSFPGVVSALGGVLSVTHGETPGGCTLNIAPQDKPPAMFGTLKITWGNNVVEIPDCRVVEASFRRDRQGRIVSLKIEDWRWRWRYGTISGRYNRRDAEGSLIAHTAKSPKELAALCFAAAGHVNFDASGLPDAARPEVDWDEPQIPMLALARLAEELGCRIVPGNDKKAFILPAGKGAALPRGPQSGAIDANDVYDPPEKPDALSVVCAPVDFQVDLQLEAVILETTGALTGEYVLPDDVSYKPAAGWRGGAETFFGITDAKSRDVARESLYYDYRIKIPAGGLEVPGYTDLTGKKVKRLDQLILLNRQAEMEEQLGKALYRPAWVFGAFQSVARNQIGENAFNNTQVEAQPITDPTSDIAKQTIWRYGFQIDAERGIVRLSERAIVRFNGRSEAADLRLRVAVNIRDPDTEEIYRYTRARNYGNKTGTKAAILRHDEISVAVVPTYEQKFKVTKVDYQTQSADIEADYYLDAQENAWQDDRPGEVTLAGIVPTALDGAIHHVVYTFGNNSAATTKVSRNTENREYVIPFSGRKVNARLSAAVARGAI